MFVRLVCVCRADAQLYRKEVRRIVFVILGGRGRDVMLEIIASLWRRCVKTEEVV